MNNKELADQLSALACEIYSARDAVYGILRIADYSVENGADMDMSAISVIAEKVKDSLGANADKLQDIAYKMGKE